MTIVDDEDELLEVGGRDGCSKSSMQEWVSRWEVEVF